MNLLTKFTSDEDGAITVDWVVLTAGVIGITLAGLSVMTGGTKSLTETISTEMANSTIMTTF